MVVLTSLEMFSFFLSLPLMFYFIYIQKVYTFSFVFEESLWVKDGDQALNELKYLCWATPGRVGIMFQNKMMD